MLLAATLLAGQPAGALARSVQKEHVRAEIVAEVESVRPGTPFWLGVHFEIDDSWYLNWLNPGDVGMAPSVRWKLPPGFQASELVWPFPRIHRLGQSVTYGYRDQLLLIAHVTPPDDLSASGSVRFGAAVDWLALSDELVPGGAELSATLPVKSTVPQWDAQWHPAFEKLRWEQPVPDGTWRVQAYTDDERRYILEVRSNDPGRDVVSCRFFPLDTDVIENAAPQRLTPCRGGFDLMLTRAHNSARIPQRIVGVLVAEGGWERSGGRRAMSIDVALERR
ncbi:MAG: protein-disulfide reductase DsbD family protein [Candidatus Latescibacterota bacterium]